MAQVPKDWVGLHGFCSLVKVKGRNSRLFYSWKQCCVHGDEESYMKLESNWLYVHRLLRTPRRNKLIATSWVSWLLPASAPCKHETQFKSSVSSVCTFLRTTARAVNPMCIFCVSWVQQRHHKGVSESSSVETYGQPVPTKHFLGSATIKLFWWWQHKSLFLRCFFVSIEAGFFIAVMFYFQLHYLTVLILRGDRRAMCCYMLPAWQKTTLSCMSRQKLSKFMSSADYINSKAFFVITQNVCHKYNSGKMRTFYTLSKWDLHKFAFLSGLHANLMQTQSHVFGCFVALHWHLVAENVSSSS